MKPRWRLERPDWRAADRALLSGVAIYGAVVIVSYLCLFIAQSHILGAGAVVLGFMPLLVLFLLIANAAQQAGIPSLQEALALKPLSFDRMTGAFAIGALAVFYAILALNVVLLPAESEAVQGEAARLSFLPLLVGILAAELFLRGYLFTRITAHAGDLYAVIVCGIFGGALYYGNGIFIVLQATAFSLLLGFARARSGSVLLPILLSLLIAVQPLLLSLLSLL